jgi:hypothetical protein
VIRDNLFSSAWIDLPSTVGFGELDVFDRNGARVPGGNFGEMVDRLSEEGPDSASFRFAVTAGEDARPRLQMQSLPAHALDLTGKPRLTG